jgi:transcriptional regulator NrdR family protein
MESTNDVQMLPQTEGKLVVKRDGTKQEFDPNKILHRIKNLAYGLNSEYLTLQEVIDKVATGLSDGKGFH